MKNSYSNIGGIFFGLMLTAVSSNTNAQTRTISGTVTSSNKPLSGVMISQEGSDQVTTTSENGTYTLQVSAENPILLFRHPDYSEERINANNQTVINISLDQNVKGIEEVILNAGYYKVKDRERTGSIAKVSAKDIENQPVNNVLSAIQGRMSGVSVTQNSGMPGGGFNIQIRGKNSLRTTANSGVDGNMPLYVVDGVSIGGDMPSKFSGTVLPGSIINPLNSIPVNDIESIEVLKDADATAIYGSRGANGVILVTTKKGKGTGVGITFNSSYGISRSMIGLEMMNTEQYVAMRKQAFANSGVSTYPATAYDINGTWDINRYTNWSDRLLGNTANFSDVSLSIKGGSATTHFLISYGHNEQTTIFGNDFGYRKNNITANLSHRSKDNRFSLNFSNMLGFQKNNVPNLDLTRQALVIAPNAPALYNSDGSLNWEKNTFTNPVAAFGSTYNNDNFQIISSMNLSYELFKGIDLRLNSGFNYQVMDESSLIPHTVNNPSFGMTSAFSQASKNHLDKLSFTLEPQMSWKFKNDRHAVEALLGATYQQDLGRQNGMRGVGFESNILITNIGAAQTKTVYDQIDTAYRYGAFFGRVNYRFNDRYILNVTGRRDGSSRFGPNNKFANFGALGVAWLFSEESWLKDLSWLSFGKLRASWGTSGSDNIGDYQYLDTYTVSTLQYNGITGLVPSKLNNPDFSWEKTVKVESALEMAFFDNRLKLSTAFYRNRSSNQLIGYQLPAITGFSSVLANLPATVENRGWEIELGGFPVRTKTFRWDSSFNLSIPKNKLLSFPGLEGSTYSNAYVVGESTSIVKLYQLQGIDPATGKYIFTDFNGDGKIASPDDNRVVENIGVRYFGGWNNAFQYKNWDFSFLFQFVKQKNRNYNYLMPAPGSMNNLPVEALNVWSADNPTGTYMPYQTAANPLLSLFQSSTASVSDASFIRLKNVQLGFNIPLQSSMVDNVRIYLQGQNLVTVTKYFGLDPEFTPLPGFLPPLRTFVLGTQINF